MHIDSLERMFLYLVQGNTPVHHAAWHSQLALLKKLIGSGAHVDTQNHEVGITHHICLLS